MLIGCLAFFAIFTDSTQAQQKPIIDSLQNLLSEQKEDTTKLKLFNGITWQYIITRTATETARTYADSGMMLSEKLNFPFGIAKSHYYYGVIDRLEGNYYSALKHFEEYNAFSMEQGDSINVANGLFHMAVINSFQGNYENSLAIYYRILRIYEKENDAYSIGTTLNSLGIIHFRLGNFDDAIENYNRALEIMVQLDAKIDIADCMHNLGNVHAELGEYEQAIDYYEQALTIDESLENRWGIAYQMENMGTVYLAMGKNKEALVKQLDALAIRKELGQKKEIAMSNIKVGYVYKSMGHTYQAIKYFQDGADIAGEIGTLPDERDAIRNLALLNAEIGNYKRAFENHLEFSVLQDSILNETSNKQINELKEFYESEKKQQEIQIQRAEIIQQKTIKNGFIIGSVLLLLLLGVSYQGYRQRIRSMRLINQQQQEINDQKIRELEKNQKLFALDAMISGQEAERKRIASDLHDSLGVLLSTVQMQFNSFASHNGKLQQSEQYGKANALLDEACTEVRKIAHNMMPGSLLKLGLVPAIQDMCRKLNKDDQLQIIFEPYDQNRRFKETAEITIYRLIQEMLNNIIKHAQANEVIVQLMNDNGNLNITVEDNGIGFNVPEALKNGGLGLKSIESRVQYLNGKLDIQSESGKGTSITVEIKRNSLYKA